MMTSLQIKPYLLERDEGERFRSKEMLISIKATSEQTSGAFNLFDVICQPNYSTSLHIHYAADVAIYVLEGALTFFWGNEKMEVVAGATLFQPRGIPHGFRVGSDAPARILYMTFPAGLDRFVLEQALLAPNSEPTIAAARYKIEIIGPLPD